jgi:hypothetical protein
VRAAQGGTLQANLTTLFTTDEAMQPLGHANYISGGNIYWPAYGVKLVPGTCTMRIQPRRNNQAANTDSDQRYSNHFYLIDKASLPGIDTIHLSASQLGGGSVDMELILFNMDYRYNQDYQEDSNGDIVSYNKTTPDDAYIYSRGATNSESVSISGLSSGTYYLLNVRAYSSNPNSITLNTSEYSYTLSSQSGGGGTVLCPANSF